MEKIEYVYYTTGEKILLEINDNKINGKKVECDEKREYTFKNLKTKIKAIDGIEGLKKFINECNREGDAFNGYCFRFLQKI